MKILRGLLIIGLAILVGVPLWAQASPRVYWTHDGLNVTRFEIVIDDGTPTNVGLPTPVRAQYSAPLPTTTAGSHSLVVRACNETQCTASIPITFVKL